METMNDNTESSRPLGFWLTAVDRLMAAEFATAFENDGITRRDWRMLNVVDGTAAPRRPLNDHKLGRLIERGWVTRTDEGWALTDDGRAAKERLGDIVAGIRSRIADAASPEDLATTMATLEQIARALGWDEETPLPRAPRRGRHGSKRRHGFGGRGFRGHGFDHPFDAYADERHAHGEHRHGHGHPAPGAHGFAAGDCRHHPGRPESAHGHGHDDHRRARFARFAQGAYERGFDAGFRRGRDS